MMETSRWLQEEGHQVILLHFKETDWGLIPRTSAQELNGIPRVGIGLVDCDEKVLGAVRAAVRYFVPDIIHAQGEINSVLNENYDPSWPPLCCGYHFWNGLVRLGPSGNQRILDHIRDCCLDPAFMRAERYPRYAAYVVSRFMQDVLVELGYSKDVRRITPVERRLYGASPRDRRHDVIQINCSLLKGGLVFIGLAQLLPDLSFYGVCSLWEELDALYHAAKGIGYSVELKDNKLLINHRSMVEWTWLDEPGLLMQEAGCLISPSAVDETFGRVIIEAIDCGCPVLASRNGNQRYLLTDDYLVEDGDLNAWCLKLVPLLEEEGRQQAASAQAGQLSKEQFNGKAEFLDFINEVSQKCFHKHVAIVAPWSEQGLGYHARAYVDALKLIGIEPHVYSYQPYSADGIGLAVQACPEEWGGHDVHYSYNQRESLSSHELYQFCLQKHCRTLLFLEVCWEVNWSRVDELSKMGIDVIVVPNPETLRQAEIHRHQQVARVFCTTRLAERLLNDNGVTNTFWIGHGEGHPLDSSRQEERLNLLKHYETEGKIRLLHVAGYNHKRKMTRELLESLVDLLARREDLELVVLSQVPYDPACYQAIRNAVNIQLKQGSFSRKTILDAYLQASFSLQLSTHEGLGLGFYESISCGTPVITIDHAPHNEVIEHGVNGILISATPMPLYDNDDALMGGGRFHGEALVAAVESLTPSLALQMGMRCLATHSRQWCLEALSSRLAQGLKPYI